jgi:prepilin-type N-terminal cleavage/methylation domain-containing protein
MKTISRDNSRSPGRARHGFSLIEMTMVMTISSVVLGICTGVLCLLWRSEHAGRNYLHQGTSAARLAQQFCDDIHASIAPPEPDQVDKSCRLKLAPRRTVVYRMKLGEVSRTEWDGRKLLRQESYDLPETGTARIELTADSKPAAACLMLPQPFGRAVHVEAVSGRDHRFARER